MWSTIILIFSRNRGSFTSWFMIIDLDIELCDWFYVIQHLFDSPAALISYQPITSMLWFSYKYLYYTSVLYVLVYFRFHTIKVYCKLCDLYRQSWFYITVVLQRLFDLTYSLYDIPACYIDSGVIFPIILITYQFDFIDLYIWEQDFLKLESCSLGSTLGITGSLLCC